jgi:hypothetical protein
VPPQTDTRWLGALTRDAFAVPLRIEMVVRPIGELHMVFGRLLKTVPYLHGIFFNSGGSPLLSHHYAGTSHDADVTPSPDGWTRVVLEIDAHECRLLTDGALRHSWQGEFAGQRSRIAIGPRQSAITVRSLTADPRPDQRPVPHADPRSPSELEIEER